MKYDGVWVVIPAHNEERTIGQVIEDTKRFCKNIIVVVDGSADKTYDIAEKKGIDVLKHVVNLGKGAALKTGCDYALSKGAKCIVAMDGDAQHDPKDIPKFTEKLKENDIVFGARKLDKTMPSVLRAGNMFINGLSKNLYGIRLSDTQCGFRAFTTKAYKKIRWGSADYSMESEMIARAGKARLSYAEVPIATVYNDRYKGTTIFDGIKIAAKMVLWKIKGG